MDHEIAPSWPSLYNPGLDILNFAHRPPRSPGGKYLDDPSVIFRFTLFWMLTFYTPVFLICAAYAFINLAFPPSPPATQHAHHFSEISEGQVMHSPRSASHYDAQTPLLRPKLSFLATPSSFSSPGRRFKLPPTAPPKKTNPVRSRLTFSILVFIMFMGMSLVGSVLVSAVVGFSLVGLYKAAGYAMSTWVPCLWAGVVVLIGLLSVWPSIIDII